MGESKRRKEILGDAYGKDEPMVSWVPFWTKGKASTLVQLANRGAWVGIGLAIAVWVTIRFIGPGLGWWTLAD